MRVAVNTLINVVCRTAYEATASAVTIYTLSDLFSDNVPIV